jgi:hypothetical protein
MRAMTEPQPETAASTRIGRIGRIGIDALLLAALLVLNACVLLVKGTERFEFFDMSAFMDAGYRVSIGQEPYVDFYYITGPVHLYMHALSFKLFGFTAAAVLVHLCFVSLLVTALVYVLARKHLDRVPSVFAGLLAVYSFYGPVCHPWYDQNATLWIILGIVLWEFFWSRTPRLVALFCGALAAVSFLTKSNVGGAGGIVLLSLIAMQPGRVKNTLIYIAGGVATLGVMMLLLESPASYIDQSFFAYATGSRLTNFRKLFALCYESYNAGVVVLTVLLALIGGKEFVRVHATRFVLLLSMSAAALFAEWTSSMHPGGNLVWMSLQGVYLILLASRIEFARLGGHARLAKLCTWLILGTAGTYALLISIERTNMLVVWMWNPKVIISDYEFQTPAFCGWHCNGRTGEGLDQVVQYINANVPKEESVFVFPDCTMIYGLTGRDSYRKMPFIFHLNYIVTGKWLVECREHFLAEPPQWIVLRYGPGETTHPDFQPERLLKWLTIDEFIRDNYGVVWSHGQFHMLRRGAGKLPRL